MERLLEWNDYVEMLRPAQDLVELLPDPKNEQLQAELSRQLFMNLSLGYFMYLQSTPEHPDWTPFLNSTFMLQPNPDDTYFYAPVRGDGVYRITGERGSVHLMTFTTSKEKMGTAAQNGPTFNYYDADELERDAEGRFEVIFSAERPAGHTGNWRLLDPRADNIVIRQRSYDWGGEKDARFAIDCLNSALLKPRPSKEFLQQRMEGLAGFARRLSNLWLGYQKKILNDGKLLNRIELTQFPSGLEVQVYWQGVYSLEPGEALILESELPQDRRYWNVQLVDQLWNATEYVYRQSSLNGAQAKIDADGRFRAVISLEDPGIANWLDPAGYESGMLIGRWFQCSSHPVPTLKKVRFADLRQHLPESTPTVTAQEREASLRARRVGAQLRRRW